MTEALVEADPINNVLASDAVSSDDDETARACAKQGELFILV